MNLKNICKMKVQRKKLNKFKKITKENKTNKRKHLIVTYSFDVVFNYFDEILYSNLESHKYGNWRK